MCRPILAYCVGSAGLVYTLHVEVLRRGKIGQDHVRIDAPYLNDHAIAPYGHLKSEDKPSSTLRKPLDLGCCEEDYDSTCTIPERPYSRQRYFTAF